MSQVFLKMSLRILKIRRPQRRKLQQQRKLLQKRQQPRKPEGDLLEARIALHDEKSRLSHFLSLLKRRLLRGSERPRLRQPRQLLRRLLLKPEQHLRRESAALALSLLRLERCTERHPSISSTSETT
jgi:hypothetical protein